MTEPSRRRLTAIVSADVVGYSRLMQADEAGTHARLRARFQELLAPSIARHGGRVFKLMGDGLLAEFPSVVAAAEWAVEVQGAVAGANDDGPPEHRIEYRVGVNLGDVIVDGDDLYGDGVNLAARLQEIAATGGVCLSDDAFRQARGKVSAPFADGGEVALKNLDVPVRVWHWAPADAAGEARSAANPALSLPDKPSIAVLPFQNMSGDPEQEYFADGMAEDIITGLSKFSWLFVIARNSSFTYKGQAVDIRAVAKDLGVRYVLEGSVRRGGPRIRVTGQLIDAETGNHLWAERYDRPLDDIFEVQDEVTSAIVAAIAPEIGQAEVERAKRKPPENLDAWALYQRALEHYPSGDGADWVRAIDMFDRACEADPDFVDALVMAAHMRSRYAHFYNPPNRDKLLREARPLLQRAMRLDPRHSMCHAATARLQVITGERQHAVAHGRDAVALNPNSALANLELGIALFQTEHYDEALRQFDATRRLSPRDPHLAGVLAAKAAVLFALERYEESADAALECSRSAKPRHWNDATLVAALCKLGRSDEMEEAKRALLSRRPDFTIGNLRINASYDQALHEALRQAGLSE